MASSSFIYLPSLGSGGGGGGGSGYWSDAVADFASLPPGAFVGEVRMTLDTNDLYRWNGSSWILYFDPTTSSTVTSVNGQIGAVVLTTTNISEGSNLYFTNARALAAIVAASPVNISILGVASNVSGIVAIANGGTGQSNQQAALNDLTDIGAATDGDILTFTGGNAVFAAPVSPPITGGANTIAGFDNSGVLESVPGWNIDTTSGGMNIGLTQNPNGLNAGHNIHNFNTDIVPLQASPDEQYSFFNVQMQLDPTSTGFPIFTNGNTNLYNLGFSHQGTANIGSLNIWNTYSSLGNGTDPIDVAGYNGIFFFGDVNPGVNLSRGIQCIDFQVHVHAGASFSTGPAFTTIFADNANIEVAVDGWNSFSASPTLANIHANRSYTGFSCGGTYQGFTGNSGWTGVNIFPNITAPNLGTGGVTLMALSSSIANLDSKLQRHRDFRQFYGGLC